MHLIGESNSAPCLQTRCGICVLARSVGRRVPVERLRQLTQNRRLCRPHGLCDVQVCSWRSARLDSQRRKFAFAVVQTCTSASATLHNAECNLAFWRVLTCTDASPLGQSSDPLGTVGIPTDTHSVYRHCRYPRVRPRTAAAARGN